MLNPRLNLTVTDAESSVYAPVLYLFSNLIVLNIKLKKTDNRTNKTHTYISVEILNVLYNIDYQRRFPCAAGAKYEPRHVFAWSSV